MAVHPSAVLLNASSYFGSTRSSLHPQVKTEPEAASNVQEGDVKSEPQQNEEEDGTDSDTDEDEDFEVSLHNTYMSSK